MAKSHKIGFLVVEYEDKNWHPYGQVVERLHKAGMSLVVRDNDYEDDMDKMMVEFSHDDMTPMTPESLTTAVQIFKKLEYRVTDKGFSD